MAQAKQFAAGVLKNLSDMMIFTNPTVNSYKRLAAEREHGVPAGVPGGCVGKRK